jgi:cobalt/nickel transport protein
MRPLVWVVGGIAVAAAIAALLAPRASRAPDGLERVARNDAALAAAFESSGGGAAPLQEYSVPGVRDRGLSTALAGIAGTLAAAALAAGAAKLLASRNARTRDP